MLLESQICSCSIFVGRNSIKHMAKEVVLGRICKCGLQMKHFTCMYMRTLFPRFYAAVILIFTLTLPNQGTSVFLSPMLLAISCYLFIKDPLVILYFKSISHVSYCTAHKCLYKLNVWNTFCLQEFYQIVLERGSKQCETWTVCVISLFAKCFV